MDFKDLADKAKGVDRDQIEDLATKAVDKVDEMTGGKVPDKVKDLVDKIDGVDDQAAAGTAN
ncbi:MAG: hypothetical protein KAZ88_04015 [Acidimicrobiia bacterium]|jgi:hypothetical protein|nr:hypothetical protein [Acidimicrobiia bacterium]MBP8180140.1 hypothetical protein [Acidimicrobiia bacterium]